MKVGIFFRIKSEFLVDAVLIADSEPYGEAIQHGGHYDFHEALIPATLAERRFKSHDYDYFPRGRVVYFPETDYFHLYADPCLTAADIQQMIATFGLEGRNVELCKDEHYQCSGCCKAYCE